jgi:hypothetical protein
MVLRNVYNHTWSDEYEILVRDIVDKAKKYVDITREQVVSLFSLDKNNINVKCLYCKKILRHKTLYCTFY